MKKEGIIFDLDGTLWNVASTTSEAWNLYFDSIGYKRITTPQEIENVTGKPIQECVAILFPGIQELYPKIDIVKELGKSEEKLLRKRGGVLYDGIEKGLFELSKRYRLFIISNCQEWYLNLFLDQFKFRALFSAVDCHGTSQISKGEMIQNMVQKHKIQNPIYIGDTQGDYDAAAGARIQFIHAAYGFGKINTLVSSIHDFSELEYRLLK